MPGTDLQSFLMENLCSKKITFLAKLLKIPSSAIIFSQIIRMSGGRLKSRLVFISPDSEIPRGYGFHTGDLRVKV